MLFPEPFLRLFGPHFAAGAATTAILAVGGLINSATGPTDIVLSMSGRPGLVLVNNAATLSVNIILNLILIPRMGIEGAGLAWTLSLAFMNGFFVQQIHRALGINPFGKSFLKGLAAGAGALAVGLGLDRVVGDIPAIAGVLVTYLGLVAVLGLDENDRIALKTLRGRRLTES
jgi:O-antigen/teichoic acid export membrane protein